MVLKHAEGWEADVASHTSMAQNLRLCTSHRELGCLGMSGAGGKLNAISKHIPKYGQATCEIDLSSLCMQTPFP